MTNTPILSASEKTSRILKKILILTKHALGPTIHLLVYK